MENNKTWNNLLFTYQNKLTFRKFRLLSYTSNIFRYGKLTIKGATKTIVVDFEEGKISESVGDTGLVFKRKLEMSDTIYEYDEDLHIENYYPKVNPNIFQMFRFFTINTSVNIIKKINSNLCVLEEKEIRPLDNSQDWMSTGIIRTKGDEITNSCKCTENYKWVQDGEICVDGNKCKLEKLQIRNAQDCNNTFTDYQPIMKRIGDIITPSSSECEKYIYKEEWVQLCGYMAKKKYPNDANVAKLGDNNLYEFLTPFIKNNGNNEWIDISCGKVTHFKLIETGSAKCNQ